jgi:hypothetical protein
MIDQAQGAPAPLTPPEKMARAKADAAKWHRIASSPNLSPRAAAWALDMARSAEAEVRLRRKGAVYRALHDPNPPPRGPMEQTDSEALAQILGLPPRGD